MCLTFQSCNWRVLHWPKSASQSPAGNSSTVKHLVRSHPEVISSKHPHFTSKEKQENANYLVRAVPCRGASGFPLRGAGGGQVGSSLAKKCSATDLFPQSLETLRISLSLILILSWFTVSHSITNPQVCGLSVGCCLSFHRTQEHLLHSILAQKVKNGQKQSTIQENTGETV